MLLPSKPRSWTTSRSREIKYEVRDYHGKLVAYKHRIEYPDGTKQTPWSRPGFEGWGLHGLKVNELPLFGVHRLLDSDTDLPVVIVEGEKAATALQEVWPLTVGMYGASHRPVREALRPLAGHPVYLWPDADEPGKEAMRLIGYDLHDLTYPVILVEPDPEWPKGYDAYDYLEDGRKLSDLMALFTDAPPRPVYNPDPFTPSSSTSTRDFYERIKEAYDIVAFISQHVELKPKGDRLHGSCPLPGHEDSTPSFVVYPETRSWYCFGCHKGGDVIDYAEEMGLELDG